MQDRQEVVHFYVDSYSDETYAGDTHVWYTVGVEYDRAYISARTDEKDEIFVSVEQRMMYMD